MEIPNKSKSSLNRFINKKALLFAFLFAYFLFVFLEFSKVISVGKDIVYIISFAAAIFLPEVWFNLSNKRYNYYLEDILYGKMCEEEYCKRAAVCPKIKLAGVFECEKLDIFAEILGRIERVFYFVILMIIGFNIDFFKIIGAWLTLRIIYWAPSKTGNNRTYEMVLHGKRASYNLFLINNLVSIGSAMIIFHIMQQLLLQNYQTCFY